MRLYVYFLFVFLVLFISCDKIPFLKKQEVINIDTILDFSKVDTYPSFVNCDSIIENNNKELCFRKTIHKKVGEELLKHQFVIKDSINEVIYVGLLIDAEGNFTVDTIESTKKIKDQLPQLDSLLKKSIQQLPKITPANKRGIPVTTKYKLPIKIYLKE